MRYTVQASPNIQMLSNEELVRLHNEWTAFINSANSSNDMVGKTTLPTIPFSFMELQAELMRRFNNQTMS